MIGRVGLYQGSQVCSALRFFRCAQKSLVWPSATLFHPSAASLRSFAAASPPAQRKKDQNKAPLNPKKGQKNHGFSALFLGPKPAEAYASNAYATKANKRDPFGFVALL